MNAVAGDAGIVHDHFLFVRAVNVIGPEAHLRTDARRRAEDVVFPVDLIHVRTFDRLVLDDLHRFSGHRQRVGGQRRDIDRPLSVCNISLAIVIKEQAGVVKVFGENRPRPRATDIRGRAHGKMSFRPRQACRSRHKTVRCETGWSKPTSHAHNGRRLSNRSAGLRQSVARRNRPSAS